MRLFQHFSGCILSLTPCADTRLNLFPFQVCQVCQETLADPKALVEHKRALHSDSICYICAKSYLTLSDLNLHISRMHPGMDNLGSIPENAKHKPVKVPKATKVGFQHFMRTYLCRSDAFLILKIFLSSSKSFIDYHTGAALPGGRGGLGPPSFQRITYKGYVQAHPLFT